MSESTRLESARLWLRHGQPEDIAAILNYYSENRDYLAPFEPRKGGRILYASVLGAAATAEDARDSGR